MIQTVCRKYKSSTITKVISSVRGKVSGRYSRDLDIRKKVWDLEAHHNSGDSSVTSSFIAFEIKHNFSPSGWGFMQTEGAYCLYSGRTRELVQLQVHSLWVNSPSVVLSFLSPCRMHWNFRNYKTVVVLNGHLRCLGPISSKSFGTEQRRRNCRHQFLLSVPKIANPYLIW